MSIPSITTPSGETFSLGFEPHADAVVSDDGTVSRTFRIGTLERRGLYVEIRLRDAYSTSPALSIVGWTQARADADWNMGGQIAEHLHDAKPYGDWTGQDIDRLAFVWMTYHLNDMQAACEHQRDAGWTYATHSGLDCPVCGYRIGSQWRRKALPADVLSYVRGLLSA